MDLDRLDAYDYELPERLIAQTPAEPRDRSRLLVVDRARGTWEHRRFRELPELLNERDLCVANNTRVLRARLLGRRVPAAAGAPTANVRGGPIGGRVEFVLLEELAPQLWEGLFHASAKYVPGLSFEIPAPDGRGPLRGKLVRGSADSPTGTVVAEFDRDPVASGAGELPLPHYIRRAAVRPHAVGGEAHVAFAPISPTLDDEQAYQTIYARHPGSAAAPTAGLHFTEQVRAGLRARGVGWAELTLHVGLGTFRPVKEAEIARHRMHEERYEISPEAADEITRAKREGRRIVAIGTTSARTLESAWDPEARALRAGAGRTAIFIHPGAGGRRFQVVDRMLTNFHLPRSTLLMMICALAGRELVLAAYREAIREEYRFYSYGDAMLIL